MAAGYISGTSGIGVAKPYEAGLYEAQQDALNRIERNRKLDADIENQKMGQVRQMTEFVKSPTDIFEGDKDVIQGKHNVALDARANYMGIAAKYGIGSEQAKQARQQFDAAQSDYYTSLNQSQNANKIFFEAQKADPSKVDTEHLKNSIAQIASTKLGTKERADALTNPFKDKPVKTVTDIVRATIKGLQNQTVTQRYDPQTNKYISETVTQTFKSPNDIANYATAQYYGNPDMQKAADKAVADVIQNTNNPYGAVLQDIMQKNGLQSLQEAHIFKEAEIQNKNQIANKYIAPNESAYQKARSRYQAKSDVESEDLLDMWKRLGMQFQGVQEALGKKVELPVLKELKDLGAEVQNINGVAYELPMLEGNTLGQKVVKEPILGIDNKPTGDYTESVVPNIVNKAYRLEDGSIIVQVNGEKKPRTFKNITQAMALLISDKDPKKQAQSAAKAFNVARELGAMDDATGVVDVNKIIPVSQEYKQKVRSMYGAEQLPRQVPQTQPKTVPTDVDNQGKPIDAKGAMKQKVEPAKQTQSEWNAAWAKLKSGESMIGLDGKTYKKK